METAPKSLQICYSACSERLLSSLLSNLDPPLPDPTWRECIVVPGRGMARWLELQLSTRLGVWAHPWFPFPEAFVQRLWRQLHPEAARGGGWVDPLEPERLRWTVAALLPGLLDQPAFHPLSTWLGADGGSGPDTGRLMSLAARIAAAYDHYLLHRPDLLRAWEADEGTGLTSLPADLADMPGATEDAAWQGPLWRAVVERALQAEVAEVVGAGPTSRRFEQIVARLDAEGLPVAGRDPLRRVSVFGLSTLSPAYLRVLAALGRWIPVHVYSLAPSPEDQRRVVNLAFAAGWGGPSGRLPGAEEARQGMARMEDVHSLLVSQAEAARSFQILAQLAGAKAQDLDAAEAESQATSLLQRLQADIASGKPEGRHPVLVAAALAGEDRSIGLHSCHGPLREAELLRDQLLAAFDELTDLAPHEIVVMCPELDRYGPYLEAVFGLGQAEGGAIPYQIADRGPLLGGESGRAIQRALAILRGRMDAPEVLDLLALTPVRAARGLDEAAIEPLWQCIEAVGISWGQDAAHRAAQGQPALEANTWRWGLTRLALGWAAPGDGRSRFKGLLPFGEASAEASALGALADLAACLGRWRERLVDARLPLSQWPEPLRAFMSELLGTGPAGEEDRLQVELALGRLAERAQTAGFAEVVSLDLVTTLLTEALVEDPPARGLLEEGVTVCAPQSLRAIPFRVLALVGMNDGVFPRGERPPGFDLAARRPGLGDGSRRDADRLLFLEALLCTRERLLITWTGQDAQSEGDLPPSILVSELVESLRRMSGDRATATMEDEAQSEALAGDPDEADGLILRHALHPFSPRYYGAEADRRWFSYAAAYASAAGPGPTSGSGSEQAEPFAAGLLCRRPPRRRIPCGWRPCPASWSGPRGPSSATA